MFSMKDKVMDLLQRSEFMDKRSSKLDINEFLQYVLYFLLSTYLYFLLLQIVISFSQRKPTFLLMHT